MGPGSPAVGVLVGWVTSGTVLVWDCAWATPMPRLQSMQNERADLVSIGHRLNKGCRFMVDSITKSYNARTEAFDPDERLAPRRRHGDDVGDVYIGTWAPAT